MFCQYQKFDSAGSPSIIRTVSGASQSSQNGASAEEVAPSTVIELRVDKLSQNTSELAPGSSMASGVQETADERGNAAITVSNILARSDEEEQSPVEGTSPFGSGVGQESSPAATDKTNTAEESEETKPSQSEEAVTESSSEDLKAATEPCDAVDMKEVDLVIYPAGDNKGESVNAMAEDSLNEEQTDSSVISGQDQTSPETSECQEDVAAGGASIFKEDLVDVSSVSDQITQSDAEENQADSSSTSAAAGDEGETSEKEENKSAGDEGKQSESEEKELTSKTTEDETLKDPIKENTEESQTEAKAVSDVETAASETPEQHVTEPSEESGQNQQPAATESTVSEQQTPDTAPPSTGQAAAEGSESTSPGQTAASSGTPEGSTVASNTEESVTKTKEIKIARLDVSNVALDTERLELKETTTTVCTLWSMVQIHGVCLVSVRFVNS